jgi:NADP-dependent 3-hydroxy acid dehydrogenase YdfG
VLAARNEQMLRAVAGQCEALGAPTLVVPTDVSVQIQCQQLVVAAVERFGASMR